MARRILVAGVPRSGTTWVARALGAAPDAVYVHEPDNWSVDPLAFLAQGEVGRFPVLGAQDRAPAYDLLWRLAMRGGWPTDGTLARARERALQLRPRFAAPALRATARAAARRRSDHDVVVAKTVQGLGALDWLAARHADAVVLVTAAPLNVVSSWRSLGWGPGYIGPAWFAQHRPDLLDRAGGWPADKTGQVAVAVATLTTLLDEAAERNPGHLVVSHEALCEQPGGFRSAYDRLGLVFGERSGRFLAESDVAGDGLETRRVTAEQPGRWRRLPADELARAEEILERFGLASRLSGASQDPA